jgi:hypothetical protein
VLDFLLDEARETSGYDERGDPIAFTDEQQIQLDVLTEKKPAKNKRLKYLAGKVVEERTALKQAPKTLLKIRRAADWFLEHLLENDIDIAQ